MSRPARETSGPAPLDVALGRRVADARARRSLSQTALGQAIGVSFQQVQHYESGANRLGFSRLCDIATALDYRLVDLIADLDAPDLDFGETRAHLSLTGAGDLLAAYAALPLGLRQPVLELLVEIAKDRPASPDRGQSQGRGGPSEPAGVELVTATLDDLPVLQALERYAAYDRSAAAGDSQGWAFDDDGGYRTQDLRPYFADPRARPYTIRVLGALAGFVIVAGGRAPVKFTLAELFVHHRFKASGVASQVAGACFQRYKGLWEVAAPPGDDDLWRDVIARFTSGAFSEARRRLQRRQQIVFRFHTDTPKVAPPQAPSQR